MKTDGFQELRACEVNREQSDQESNGEGKSEGKEFFSSRDNILFFTRSKPAAPIAFVTAIQLEP
jgi:hypothetical protein